MDFSKARRADGGYVIDGVSYCDEEEAVARWFGWCCCGLRWVAFDLVRKILVIVRDVPLPDMCDYMEAAIRDKGCLWFVLYELDAAGLVEHESSVMCPRLTDKGRELLSEIEQVYGV